MRHHATATATTAANIAVDRAHSMICVARHTHTTQPHTNTRAHMTSANQVHAQPYNRPPARTHTCQRARHSTRPRTNPPTSSLAITPPTSYTLTPTSRPLAHMHARHAARDVTNHGTNQQLHAMQPTTPLGRPPSRTRTSRPPYRLRTHTRIHPHTRTRTNGTPRPHIHTTARPPTN